MDDRLVAAIQTGALGAAPALVLVGLGGRRFAAPALALGVAAVFVAFKGWPELPQVLWSGNNDGTMWLLWCACAAAAVGWFDDLGWLPRRLSALSGMLCCGAMVLLPTVRLHGLGVDVKPRWSPIWTAIHLAIGAALAAVAWIGMARAQERRPGLLLPIVWTLCVLADSVALLHSGSGLQGQLAGGLAAALGTATATWLWRRPFVLGRGAVLALAIAHVGLVGAGHHLGELPAWPALALALAPVCVCLGGVPALAQRSFAGGAVAAAAALAAAGGAVWATWDAGGGGY